MSLVAVSLDALKSKISIPVQKLWLRFRRCSFVVQLLFPRSVRTKLLIYVGVLHVLVFFGQSALPAWIDLGLFWILLYLVLKSVLGSRLDTLATLVRRGILETDRIDTSILDSRDELGRLGSAILDMAQRLRESTQKANDRSRQMDELLSAVGEGVVLVDQEAVIIKINNVVKKWCGWYGQAEGRLFSDVIKNIELSRCLAQVIADIQKDEAKRTSGLTSKSTELKYLQLFKPRVLESVHLDGPESRRLKAKIVPIEVERRQGVVLMVYLHDVTEAHQSEMLRSEFFANVSHELKTPIAAIQGYAEVLRDMGQNLDSAQYQKFIGTIERNASDLAVMIDEMVTIARLESGADKLELVDYDLKKGLERVFETCLPKAHKAQVTLESDVADAARWVQVDAQRFDSVLLNLVDNAVKYNRPGGQVRVSTRAGQDEVLIYIEDTGLGIKEDAASRIFERFYRVDKSHTRLGGGTGLGLAIVKHVISAHGGKISVRSELGSGTVFKVVLPSHARERKLAVPKPIVRIPSQPPL